MDIQVVLVASDCHPRLLTKHLESLAISKKVPIVFVKDKKRGSLRLGELVKLKTAIAIGVKVGEFYFFWGGVWILNRTFNLKCVIWYALCRIKETSLVNSSAMKCSITLNELHCNRSFIHRHLMNCILWRCIWSFWLQAL